MRINENNSDKNKEIMFSIFDIESNLHRLNGYEDIYFSEDKYSHYTSLFTIINGIILKVQKKDCKDFEKFIHDCIEIFTTITNNNIQKIEIRKIPLQRSISNFTSIILIPYELCNHNPINEDIERKTLLAAPIYDCEFSGDENGEELKAMITLPYATVRLEIWEREVSPKLKMSYSNYTLKSHSQNKTFKLTKTENLFWALDTLKDDLSYIGIENFKHEKYLISWDNGKHSLIPNIKFTEQNFDETINNILLGKNKYPVRLIEEDKINIEAVEASSSNLKRIIKSNFEAQILKKVSGINIIQCNNSLSIMSSENKKIAIFNYVLTPLNFYKNEGCCYRLTLSVNLYDIRIIEILKTIGLLNHNLSYLCLIETDFDFHIASGICKGIFKSVEMTVSLIHTVNNLLQNKISVIEEIEDMAPLYKFPTFMSLLILFFRKDFSYSLIQQVLKKANDKNYCDLAIAKEKLSILIQLCK